MEVVRFLLTLSQRGGTANPRRRDTVHRPVASLGDAGGRDRCGRRSGGHRPYLCGTGRGKARRATARFTPQNTIVRSISRPVQAPTSGCMRMGSLTHIPG